MSAAVPDRTGVPAPRRPAPRSVGVRLTTAHQVEQCVHRAIDGDDAAWTDLVATFGGLIRSIARRNGLSPGDVDDVTQATWVRLLRHIDRIERPAQLSSWLATTAHRESLRLVAKQGRVVPTADDHELEPGARAEPPLQLDAMILQEEDETRIRAAVAQLGERDRQLLRLLFWEPQTTYETIASTLRLPRGSIGPTRARCLNRLRRLLVDA